MFIGKSSAFLLITFLTILLCPFDPSHASGPDQTALTDMLSKTENFLRINKNADGITPETRALNYPTEQIRLNIVPQLLGYIELYHQTNSQAHLEDAISRADYLVKNIEIRKHKSYDGMLGYALLLAYQTTANEVYKQNGLMILEEMLLLPLKDIRLNTGLMAAMGMAISYELTREARILHKLQEVFQQLKLDQNADGSFPHAYDGEDLHYSSWMAMELVLIERCLKPGDLPELKPMLNALHGFIKKRVRLAAEGSFKKGEPSYQEEICDVNGSCKTAYYYARATASKPEYDTRGWSNEVGYEIFTFNYFKDTTEANASVAFLQTLQNNGAFPDKWSYPIEPESEQYPWSTASQSVVRTSLLFWELASALNQKNFNE